MKRMLKRALWLGLVMMPVSAYSWGPVGHMLVANIAYQKLNPEVRGKVDQLVSYLHTEYPSMAQFTQVAIWPDTLGSQKIISYQHWHYIDVPLSGDGTSLAGKDLIDDDNAVWALNSIQGVVKNEKKGNPYERARFLSFLVHIVGDLHQPLHTVSYVSEKHPDGDRGGNDYHVRYAGSKTQLHHVWDTGVGAFNNDTSPANIAALTDRLTSRYPESYFGNEKLEDIKPENWTKEGMANAKEYVYITTEDKELSSQYVQNGQRLADQQVTLAGYRLARMLNTLLS